MPTAVSTALSASLLALQLSVAATGWVASAGDPYPDLPAVLGFMPGGTLRLAPVTFLPAVALWLAMLGVLRGRARRSAAAALIVVVVWTPVAVGWAYCRALYEVSGPAVRFTWSPKPAWISWSGFESLGSGFLILTVWLLELVAVVWAARAAIPFGVGQCKRCGYSRAGLAGEVCPECGVKA